MDTSQKLGVASVFLLAWVTIAFDIIRVVETFRLGSAFAVLYTTLEAAVAVIISALPAYKALLKRAPFRLGKGDSISSKGKDGPSHGSHLLKSYLERDSEYSVHRGFNQEPHHDHLRMDPLHQSPLTVSHEMDSPV